MQLSRLAAVDALRGIAALFVVWQHGAEMLVQIPAVAARGRALADIAHALDFGRIGVVCFFLISGFVIPSSLRPGPGGLRVFLVRRFFRLYPAYWVSVLATIGVLAFLGIRFSGEAMLANAAMIQTYVGQPHLQGLYWTLEAELAFYALCVVLFMGGFLRKTSVLVGACGLLAALFAVLKLLEQRGALADSELLLLPGVLAFMFAGALWRLAFEAPGDVRARGAAWAGTALAFAFPAATLIGGLALGLSEGAGAAMARFGASNLLGLSLFALGFKLLRDPPRPLLWLGNVSYSLYLLHVLVIYLLVDWLREKAPESLAGFHVSVYLAVALAASLLVAGAAHALVEKPAIRAGKRLSQRFQAS